MAVGGRTPLSTKKSLKTGRKSKHRIITGKKANTDNRRSGY